MRSKNIYSCKKSLQHFIQEDVKLNGFRTVFFECYIYLQQLCFLNFLLQSSTYIHHYFKGLMAFLALKQSLVFY